jgi:DNA polymerase III delta prime subunit
MENINHIENINDSNKLFLSKYQPQLLEHFTINSSVINTLYELIKLNKLNILFIGDVGTGKTTFLNALIREYYKNIPTNLYSSNILPINSLKEQGINFCRNDVKTFCQTHSSINGKKKIVLLDDIDLIGEQSQQVFRNFIDKYSTNVHFIATCSNSQKVIETLQSRFNIIKIHSHELIQLNQLMNTIIANENLNISHEAQNFLLNISNGSAKILINYLEKIKLLNLPIDLQIADNICSNISFLIFEEYTREILNKNLHKAIKLIYEIYDKGYSVMDILDNYFIFIKFTNILTESQKYEIIPTICKYIAAFHNIHEDELELALFTNNIYNSI